MPDAGASRKRQIPARGFPGDLTPDPSASNAFEADAGTPGRWAGKRRRPWNCYVCVVNAAGIGQCRSGFFVHAGWSAVSSGASLPVEIPFRRSPARTLRRDIAGHDSGSCHRAMAGIRRRRRKIAKAFRSGKTRVSASTSADIESEHAAVVLWNRERAVRRRFRSVAGRTLNRSVPSR
jgi:hypothetical protein